MSDVSQCNLALSHLGDEATVSSLDPPEGSAQADHCATFYPIARRALIEMRGWSFATRRANLAEAADDPPATWAYAYALPAQCIRVVAILSPEQLDVFDAWWSSVVNPAFSERGFNDFQTQPFIQESNTDGALRIYTNIEEAICIYMVDVTDTTRWTPLFGLAQARLLASFLAGPVIKGTAGMQVAAAQREFFEKVELPQAAGSNANASQFNAYSMTVPDGIKARM